ncbi:aromatic/alkene monooxygenase hydroxylase subunit beta [Pseudonocardia broussonetiae]|uniref:propane 2-monooxygenase n=1 Tax=Pseudonocardia broussonetiae TaxID=2736640 RepID=A0A6M6JQ38_9PSEU|nr:aromatic/alkene monooxygenase hydroxylase subunit beta [Pseudonocardia broussonetiae]QJY49360.1 toluene monooxygenase [Pseudonocardia broussonetiae]
MTAPLKPLKTWAHLTARRRKPSEYEIVSTKLLWHTRDAEQPWDVAHTGFMADFYREHRNQSPVTHPDWDAFRDPDELVYRTYNILQDGQETYVEGLLDQHNAEGHDRGLSPEWVATLAQLYTPSRYLLHTVQMASAYLVHIAPSSTIANCAAFQAADSLRWLSNVAYRTAELGLAHPGTGFGQRERELWEELPAWQGFRELMERQLVTFDWAEAFVALNVVAKPAIDEIVLRQLGVSARRHGDVLHALLTEAALRDSERSRRWTEALVKHMSEVDSNLPQLTEWVAKWQPLGEQAVRAYGEEIAENVEGADNAVGAVRAFQRQLGLGS